MRNNPNVKLTGDPNECTPTNGNDDVEAMCERLYQAAEAAKKGGIANVATVDHTCAVAILMLRKQAVQIAELQKDAVGLEAAFSVRTDEVDGLLGQLAGARAQIAELQKAFAHEREPEAKA